MRCRDCRTRHHRSCRGKDCTCECRWAVPAEERLLVGCWCEEHLFNVPVSMVRAGQTVSCGEGCP